MVDVLRGASAAFALKILAAGLAFGFNVVLGRTLGAEAAGVYFLALSTATIAAVIGRVGLDNTLVRFIAANVSIDNWSAVKGVYQKAVLIGFVCSAAVALALGLGADQLAQALFSDPDMATPIRLMALVVVPLALGILYSQALRGLSRIRDSLLVLSVLPMFFVLVGTAALAAAWDVEGAIIAYLVAVILALIYGWVTWRRASLPMRSLPADFSTRDLLKSSLPLFGGSLLNLVTLWSSTLMLGIWEDKDAVGVFAVAARTAALISFVLVAVNAVAAPKFAALYRKGEMTALDHTARHSTLLVTVLAAPAFLLFMLCSTFVMALFGSDFSHGGEVLRVLAIGQFVNVATGSVAFLLMMCGYEQLTRNNQFVAACLVLALNALLIPSYGAMGAAVATTAALIVQNMLAAYFVWRKLGIITVPGWQHSRRNGRNAA